MSSILKALKKVETDLAQQPPQRIGSRQVPGMKGGLSHGGKTFSASRKHWVWVLCIVVLIAAGWLSAVNRPGWIQNLTLSATFQKTEKTRSSGSDGGKTGTETPPVASEKGSARRNAVSAGGTRTTASPSKNRTEPNGITGPSPAGKPVRVERQPSSKSFRRSNGTLQPELTRKSGATGQRQKAAPKAAPLPEDGIRTGTFTTRPSSAAVSGRIATEEISQSVPEMRASELKLHAIAWSPEPAERMAVINNSITREGESVDGFSVVRIAQDEIEISDGQKRWRLMLRR